MLLTEETAEGEELPKCPSLFTGKEETCLGGVLVMDGTSGATLWQRWTAFQIFSVFCTNDINNDTRTDCVASGRNGIILAVDGTSGNTLWESSIVSDLAKITLDSLDLYTINVIRDVNDDGVNDIVASHVETNGKFALVIAGGILITKVLPVMPKPPPPMTRK